jgi:hypothetical protein
MAGKCVLCNNLKAAKIFLNGKEYDSCICIAGWFGDLKPKDVQSYFTMDAILKPSKEIKEIEEKCDKWDDRLKAKSG